VIKDRENGSTLKELAFTAKDTVTVSLKTSVAQSKAPLLDENGQLNDRAKYIFNQMFDQFSVFDGEYGQNVMGPPEVA